MTSALSMSNNQLQPTTSIKADLGGGGGLRGTTAVPSPLSSPCPFPTPDAEWGSGGECLYRGGRSQGRGPAWYLFFNSSHSYFYSYSFSYYSYSFSYSYSSYSPCPFPAPCSECGSGWEYLYRGGCSRGRGSARFLFQSSFLPPTFLPRQLPFSTPLFPSSYSSTSSFFIVSSPPSNRGFQTWFSSGVSSPSEGLPKSSLLCGREKPCLLSSPWKTR